MGKHYEKDVWKPLVFCNGKYQVSRFGKVKSIYTLSKFGRIRLTGTVLKTQINSRGYEKVDIGFIENGVFVVKKMAVHRLVATAFIPNPENKPEVNHKDLNPRNNHFLNLEWVTSKENAIHAHKNKAGMYKFTEDQVTQIREMVDKIGISATAHQMKEHYCTIYNIATRNRAIDDYMIVKIPRQPFNSYKKVVDITSGKIMNTKEVSLLIGKSLKEIHRQLNGERPNRTNFHYL